MAKTIEQIGTEQQIYLAETFTEKITLANVAEIWEKYELKCKEMGIVPIEKLISMIMHFLMFIEGQEKGEHEVATCKQCISAKAKIAELPWNKEK